MIALPCKAREYLRIVTISSFCNIVFPLVYIYGRKGIETLSSYAVFLLRKSLFDPSHNREIIDNGYLLDKSIECNRSYQHILSPSQVLNISMVF